MKKLFQIASPIIATFYIIAIGLMANETYVNKTCTEILNTKEHTIPGGYFSHSATCSSSSCVYLCKRKKCQRSWYLYWAKKIGKMSLRL
ncbi:unnamed protein product [Brassica oleracea var. botrytis]